MKLYTKPGACSTADHIALHWSGGEVDVQVVDSADLKSEWYRGINPTGSVLALQDGDFVLTQNAAIPGYIADCFPDACLGGDGSARERPQVSRWLSFVGSDVHPGFMPLFHPARFIGDEAQHDTLKQAARARLRSLFEQANQRLSDREWLADARSVADAYFYITLRWAELTGVDLSGIEDLGAFRARMDADPGVHAALEAEGLH
ncbi:glutathione binding-like protein [Cognatilysobacter bugurensis]|uniref:Glutathione S-transferase GST-4.5 n=1 Tax=Cognatilysobacter bugurensis TaxID=543356 RepID=A0A918WBM1_9GAMM|nr:glutathione binding-like protein [Lysobacter bugurensis]GHA90655.1 glutathione S-transferase GST-4.5 [Lysobacter bugurensis]